MFKQEQNSELSVITKTFYALPTKLFHWVDRLIADNQCYNSYGDN